MANTFSKIYLHFIFGVRHREALIPRERKEEIHRYTTAIIQKNGCQVQAIHCMPDHMHVLVSMKPKISPSELMQEVKAVTSKWINEKGWTSKPFRWQTGFATISHSESQVPQVIRYIQNQEEHHRTQDWKKEFVAILERFNIPHDPRYLFDQET